MISTKQYLGARIQEFRKQNGLKQSELAEILNIDPKYMSKIECGYCFPSFELLDRIADALNRPVGEFLNTEHLQNRESLLQKIILKLQNTSEEKFRTAYKIINEIV